jgi:hypothetical protein
MTAVSCRSADDKLTTEEFNVLMTKVANSWTLQDTESAVECFMVDAEYYQPPDQQFYKGHSQLRRYFKALKKGTVMKFHNLWFDKQKQMGVGEFTFGNINSKTGVTGVTIVTTKNQKINTWREYFISGPLAFDEFISTEGKNWK